MLIFGIVLIICVFLLTALRWRYSHIERLSQIAFDRELLKTETARDALRIEAEGTSREKEIEVRLEEAKLRTEAVKALTYYQIKSADDPRVGVAMKLLEAGTHSEHREG